jgi:hypothetical protein
MPPARAGFNLNLGTGHSTRNDTGVRRLTCTSHESTHEAAAADRGRRVLAVLVPRARACVPVSREAAEIVARRLRKRYLEG